MHRCSARLWCLTPWLPQHWAVVLMLTTSLQEQGAKTNSRWRTDSLGCYIYFNVSLSNKTQVDLLGSCFIHQGLLKTVWWRWCDFLSAAGHVGNWCGSSGSRRIHSSLLPQPNHCRCGRCPQRFHPCTGQPGRSQGPRCSTWLALGGGEFAVDLGSGRGWLCNLTAEASLGDVLMFSTCFLKGANGSTWADLGTRLYKCKVYGM